MAAVYPGAIKTWTQVQDNVDDIKAKHINDLYDEVIAVEVSLDEEKQKIIDQQGSLDGKVAKIDIINDLTTGGTTKVLSAEQGKQLNTYIYMPASNLITSGDLSSVTGWLKNSSDTIAILNNIGTVTGGGANTEILLSQAAMDFSLNDKIFTKCKIRVRGAGCTQLKCRFLSGYKDVVIASPVEGQWYTINELFNTGGAGNWVPIAITATYPDTATQSGKQLEIDGVYGAMLVNLTTSYGTGNEPTIPQFNTILSRFANSFFSGTVNLFSGVTAMQQLSNAIHFKIGTYAARPTSLTQTTAYLSTDKAAGNADRLTISTDGTTWYQI